MYLDGSRSKIIDWVAEGLSDRAIGEYLRVSASTVRAWREKNGVVRTAVRASSQLSTAWTVSYRLPGASEPTRFPGVTSLVRARRFLNDAINATPDGRVLVRFDDGAGRTLDVCVCELGWALRFGASWTIGVITGNPSAAVEFIAPDGEVVERPGDGFVSESVGRQVVETFLRAEKLHWVVSWRPELPLALCL